MRQVFGSENAAHDDLLEECYIAPPGAVLDRPILIGKWGTGKTGLLLNRNARLSQILRLKDPSRDRIWYLDETGVQLQTLKVIERISDNNIHLTKRILEDLWKSEIMRVAGTVLMDMHQFYGSPPGVHWTALSSIFSKTNRKSVWDMLPSALGIVVSNDKAASASELLANLRSLHDEAAFQAIQRCLNDVRHHAVQPVVAIEPIETPTSSVEEQTDLAQVLVTCLLNVYYRHFCPSSRQLLKVEVSIPWHRFKRDQVGEPQKLYPFIGRFRWTKTSLRAFINKRIEWEFRRVRRTFSAKGEIDAWSALFPESVKNTHSNQSEKSFDYMLRHSQYRVRDMLRLTRESVDTEAVNRGVTVDEVLLGRGGLRLSQKTIKAAVVRVCKITAGERLQEGDRRFPGLERDVEVLRAISVPFSIDDVKRRAEKRQLDLTGVQLLNMMGNFWSAGIIGVQLVATSESAIAQLRSTFESGSMSPFNRTKERAVFYVFEHSYEKNFVDIINTYAPEDDEHGDIAVNIILHPMLFEFLDARVSNEAPIGV